MSKQCDEDPAMKPHEHRRSAANLLLSGIGSISLDQTLRQTRVATGRKGIASDWQAIGDDLRRAMRQIDDTEAA